MQKFKIYPEWGKLYYEVFIYDTHKEMKENALDFKEWYPDNAEEGLDGAGAVTIPFTTYKQEKDGSQGKMLPYLGQILFCRETQFDEVVIAHECLHALIFYTLRKGISIEKVFFGQDSTGIMKEELNNFPGAKRVSKTIPDEILKYEHERFCMAHSYMMEQIISKSKINVNKERTNNKTRTR